MKLLFPPMEPDFEAPLKHLPKDAQVLIQSYTKLMRHLEGEAVFLLDGKWGSGKTTLVKAWEAYLKKEKEGDYEAIHIDAFSHDFNDNPLLMIGRSLSEIGDGELKENFRTLLKGLKPFVAGLISAAAGSNVSSAIDEYIGHLLKEDEKEQIKKFRKELKKYTEKKNKKIVIFIDELDRCRPDFSITTLEKIKHIFSVEGVIFILVANTVQLNASLRGIYGDNIDAQEYWKKIIGYTIYMPPIEDYNNLPFLHQVRESIEQDLKTLKPEYNDSEYRDTMKFYFQFLHLIAPKHNLSYRQLQKLHLEICFSLINGARGHMSIILIYLRCQYGDLYQDIRNQDHKKNGFFERINYLDAVDLCAEKDNRDFLIVVPAILALVKVISPQEYKKALKECQEVLNQKDYDPFERIVEANVQEICKAGYHPMYFYSDVESLSTVARICRRLDKFELATK